MAHESLEYKGHHIEADTNAIGKGFSWSYTIDGANFSESQDRPLQSEPTMLREAIESAKRRVDALPLG